MEVGAEFWENLSDLYQNLFHQECLCDVNLTKNHREMIEKILIHHSCQKEFQKEGNQELKLLGFAITQLTTKICLRSDGSPICEEIVSLAKYMISDAFLDNQVHCLMSNGNKFLHRAVLRSLTLLLYMLDEEIFSVRVEKLVGLLKSSESVKSSVNLLNLFELIMDYSLQSVHVLEPHSIAFPTPEKVTCKKQIQQNYISSDDLKHKFCVMLCDHWVQLVNKFFNNRNLAEQSNVFIAFLCLWRSSLKAVHEDQEVLKLMFNNVQLINLFVTSTPTEPVSLKIFLDVLIQALSLEDSSLPFGDRQSEDQGELLISAINSGLLENIPIADYKCGFGGVSAMQKNQTLRQSLLGAHRKNTTSNCDEIAVKKIVFIVLKILSASKVSPRLLTAFWNAEVFAKNKMHLPRHMPAHLWILDVFFDQDDLLIASLLSSLHLYANLRVDSKYQDVPEEDIISLRRSLNPHKAFSKFLQRLGGDCHIILDFLLSNETCMLCYLTQYLKMVLSEQEAFFSAHGEFEDSLKHFLVSTNGASVLDRDVHDDEHSSVRTAGDFVLEENICLPPSVPFSTTVSQKAHLVSYSSSSSSCSDSESLPVPVARSHSSCLSTETVTIEWIVSVLEKLRKALEKLVRSQKFPYRVDPLIELLRKCEEMCNIEQQQSYTFKRVI